MNEAMKETNEYSHLGNIYGWVGLIKNAMKFDNAELQIHGYELLHMFEVLLRESYKQQVTELRLKFEADVEILVTEIERVDTTVRNIFETSFETVSIKHL